MFTTLSRDPQVFIHWNWSQIKPYVDELTIRPLSSSNLTDWVKDWSDLNRLTSEMFGRLWVATTCDTADKEAKNRFNTFLDQIFTPSLAANQVLKQKLLQSGLQPEGFEIPLRNMRVEAEIYREENLPLLSEERKLENEYDEIIGAQTVKWEGKEITTTQLMPVSQSLDRSKREEAWRVEMQRKLADRENINQLWQRFLGVRSRLASQAGFPDYRAYRWKELLRFDYTPEDCIQFHQAIEKVVVPAAKRIYARRQERMGLSSLRPWDLQVDPLGREPLKPFNTIAELEEKVSTIFYRVDPELGSYFDKMRRNGLLDLENRKNKAPGAYCNDYDMVMLPFIFANAVGLQVDISTLLHEGGHAFHVFEEAHLPYYHQLMVPMEFAEVASMGMELLASQYLAASAGGFYSEQDAARARIDSLEEGVLFWPYMAVVDGFQHWVYLNLQEAMEPEKCDQKWTELWHRFMGGVDWDGLEEYMETGWQRKQHIFETAFYYVEYGMAALGASQVWANSMKNHKKAIEDYRKALALGGTVPLPVLYQTAGAKFSFDTATLLEAVTLAEGIIDQLEKV